MTPKTPDNETHYGPLARKPDMDAELFAKKVREHMDSLGKSQAERDQLELNTRGDHSKTSICHFHLLLQFVVRSNNE